MIPRYEVKEISKIWSEEARFEQLLKVERALLLALEEKGRIPKGTARAFDQVKIRPERIHEIEESTRHDVIAFCTSITEQVAPTAARYFHFGVTSSDILDTALSLQIRDSVALISNDLKKLCDALLSRARETQDLLALGRSHGMAAEPMIFGQKFLSAYTEVKRRLRDYEHVLEHEITGQISGAVGNYTVLTPEIEASALGHLKLPVESVTSQVIPRDHLALIISIGALTASALERLAVEIRHLPILTSRKFTKDLKPDKKVRQPCPIRRIQSQAKTLRVFLVLFVRMWKSRLKISCSGMSVTSLTQAQNACTFPIILV